MRIQIAPDFEHLLPQLTEDEIATLTANVLADKKHERMPPVLVWSNHHNTIIDGHNQYRIRSANGCAIKYLKLEFETRAEAMMHTLNVQFGRRNLNASQRAMAYAKLPRMEHGGDRRSDQVVLGPLETAESLATKASVSPSTMHRAIKVEERASAAVKRAVTKGKVSVKKAAAVAELPKSKQMAAIIGNEEEDLADAEKSTDELCEEHNSTIEKAARAILKAYKEAVPSTLPYMSASLLQSAESHIKAGCNTLRQAKSSICPNCEGGGCRQCHDHGYLPTLHAKQLGRVV